MAYGRGADHPHPHPAPRPEGTTDRGGAPAPAEEDGLESVDEAAVAGVIARPRLYAALDAPSVRVCILQGPSGAGKTTLVRSWTLRQVRPIVWISLTDGVDSRPGFWELVTATACRLGEFPEPVALRGRQRLTVAMDPVPAVGAVLAAIGPAVLVLDAYEHLGGDIREIDGDLARLLRAVPSLRLMVTTRSPTALAEHDPLGGGAIRVLSVRELAFTTAEVRRLVADRTGVNDEHLAASVTAATKGFALTVRAVVLALGHLGHIPDVGSLEWDEVVAARLESLLPDSVTVQLVIDTSVPPYVDVELGERLSGNPETAEQLRMLEAHGFGRWIPYARDRAVFQYVEEVRDAFRSRASADPQRFRRACATTAAWLFENGACDQALSFAVDGHDYLLAERVFMALVIANPDTYTSDRFLPILRAVPRGRLAEHPMLAFGLGLALAANPMLRSEAPAAFRIAAGSTVGPSYLDPEIDGFAGTAMQAIARRLASDYEASADGCADALAVLEAIGEETVLRHRETVGTILRQVGYSLLQGGRIEEALRAIQRSVSLCASPTTQNYSIVYAAGTHAFAGDVEHADRLIGSIDTQAWPAERRRTYLDAMRVVARCYRLLDALDFSGAAQALRDTDCFTPTTEFWPFLTAVSVSARHGLGQARAEAERVTRELEQGTAPPGVGANMATERLVAVLALAWLAAGAADAATRILSVQRGASPHLAGAQVATWLGSGHHRNALRDARAAMELPGHTIRTRAETQTWGAVAALHRGEPELAWSWLNASAVAAETYGVRLHVGLLTPGDRQRLAELARDRGGAGVRRFLEVPASHVGRSSRPAVALTRRETAVLSLLVRHDSAHAIARELVVSQSTVKSHLQSIYRKLGVSSRRAAIAVAEDLGMLDGVRRRP